MGFSEFGRRAYENGSVGCDHGAAGLMFVLGGAVRGGLYGTAASLNPDPSNPTLENNGGDVRHQTDFRSVYARVIDGWLGADSVAAARRRLPPPGPRVPLNGAHQTRRSPDRPALASNAAARVACTADAVGPIPSHSCRPSSVTSSS